MLLLRKPSPAALRRFLASQAGLDLTYESVRGTAGQPPAGYVVDHTRVRLGVGEAVYDRARSALERWEHFRLGWLEAWPVDTPIRTGAIVVVLARALGLWWLNACRIVYVVDEPGDVTRFGFAYGTLPAHAGTGEERFLVEWDREDDSVWYDILAFSRPRQVLARVGYWLMRRLQKRFGRGSAAAMRRAINLAAGERPA